MRSFRACGVAVVVMSLVLVGCGGGDDAGKSGGSSSAAASDTGKPLGGKELGKSSQLKGTWLAQNEGMYIGFEFMDDGKALVTPFTAALTGLNSAIMMKYDVIDGGRMTLTAPDGQTMVMGTTIKGDMMDVEVGKALSDTGVQRFKRLPAGQTLAEAIKLKEEADAKERQAKYEALQAFIKEEGLVIVPVGDAATSPAAPPAIAVNVSAAGSRAWHDDKPPHMDQISLSPNAGGRNGDPQIQVSYGQQLAPPTTQRRPGGSFAFTATGDAGNTRYIAKVNYGNTPMELELKKDASLHKEIVGRFEAELARIEDLKKPLIAALNDYAVIEGTAGSIYPNQPKDSEDRFILVRDEKTGTYKGGGATVNGNTGVAQPMANMTAVIEIVNNKPLLMVKSYVRQYQLSLADASTGELTGGWFPPGNQNGRGVKLTIVKSMSTAERTARDEAHRKVLESLSGSEPFVGLVDTRYAQFLPPPNAISLTLTAGGDGKFTGTATTPIVNATMDLQGQIVESIAGPTLQLQFTNLREQGSHHAGNIFMMLRNQKLNLTVADAGESGPIKLADGGRVLTQATAEYKAELRKKLIDAMAGDGLKMQVVDPPAPNNGPQLVVAFKSDADGKITSTFVSGSNSRAFNEQGTIEGELKDVGGLPMLAVMAADPKPEVAGRFQRINACELVAFPTDNGWVIVGSMYATHQPKARGYVSLAEVRN